MTHSCKDISFRQTAVLRMPQGHQKEKFYLYQQARYIPNNKTVKKVHFPSIPTN